MLGNRMSIYSCHRCYMVSVHVIDYREFIHVTQRL